MTTTTNQNAWDTAYFQPRPEQDRELKQQLGFIPGLKELLMLRQVHALEHGTIWLLSQGQDDESLGGLSTESGFYVYGQVNPERLKRAVNNALQRLQEGEWNLAIHPRCGTNLSVAMVLAAGLTLGTHLILPRDPISQLIGLGLAANLSLQLAPEIGSSVQKYLTTGIPFNLKLVQITLSKDFWGRQAHFVSLDWQD